MEKDEGVKDRKEQLKANGHSLIVYAMLKPSSAKRDLVEIVSICHCAKPLEAIL